VRFSYTGLLHWGCFFVDRSTSIDCSIPLLSGGRDGSRVICP
jgi:hypothetical protein